MEEVLVILTLDAVPSQVISFKGEHDEIFKKAEEQFLKICSEYIGRFKNYTPEDKDAILEDGWEMWDHVNSVAIHWMT